MGRELSILLLTYNRCAFTYYCLEALKIYTDFSCVADVLIGDCHSTDGTEELITSYGFVSRVYKVPHGSVATNMKRGAEFAQGKYVLKLDNDILVSKDWNLKALTVMKAAEKHKIRIIGYDLSDENLRKASIGRPIRLDDCGYTLQPMKYVGGRIITSKALLLEENCYGHLDDMKGQYHGWWQWHQAFEGQIAAILPRLACFDMTRIQQIPPGYEYISQRRGEPIVERLIRENPLQLKRLYVGKKWMREHV